MKKKRQTVAWDSLHAYYRKQDLSLQYIQVRLGKLRLRSGVLGAMILYISNSLLEIDPAGVLLVKLTNNLFWDIGRIVVDVILIIVYFYTLITIGIVSKNQDDFFKEVLKK